MSHLLEQNFAFNVLLTLVCNGEQSVPELPRGAGVRAIHHEKSPLGSVGILPRLCPLIVVTYH